MATTIDSTTQPTEGEARLLVRAGRTIWDHFALLLLIDIVLMVALLPAVVLLLGGLPVLALPAAVFACGPVLAGAASVADRLNGGEAITVAMVVRSMRTHALRGMAVLAVPAVLALVMLSLLSAMSRFSDASWLVVPLLLTCSMAIILVVAGVAVLSLATTGGLRGWPLWRASLAVGVANPVATVGMLALAVLLVLVVPQGGMVLLAVAPAPVLVLCSAICWETVARHAASSGVR